MASHKPKLQVDVRLDVSRRCGAAPGGAVLLQQRHTAKRTRADTALVLLDLGVSLQVSAQVGAVSEGPVTVGAGERPLAWKKE